jgi:hypothetical protein
VVNIGTRQNARDRGSNVLDVPYGRDEIKAVIARQVNHGPYAMEPIYGDGHAGQRIADILSTKVVDVQKCITY